MIEKEPRILISDIISFFFFYIGFLFIYTLIFITSINSINSFNSIFLMWFRLMTVFLVASIIFGGSTLLIHILRWLVWFNTTPEWVKNKNKK